MKYCFWRLGTCETSFATSMARACLGHTQRTNVLANRRKHLCRGNTMDKEHNLTGGAQEWLRRIALNRPFVIVPDAVAVVLTDIGFMERFADGSLAATAAGRAYLDSRGIVHAVASQKSISSKQREVDKRSVHALR